MEIQANASRGGSRASSEESTAPLPQTTTSVYGVVQEPRSAREVQRMGRGSKTAASVDPNAYPVNVLTRLASTLLAALTLAAVPSVALAKSGDSAATRAYVRANYALVRAARFNLATGEAALKGLVRQITGQCPLAAAESPENHDSEQLSNEVVGAMTIVAYHPDAAAMDAFAHTVRGLHWSNRELTHIVHTYATQLEGLATLAIPEVCGDVEAWVASGYQTLPTSTLQFDQRYYADDIEAEEVPLRLLTPYESAGEASLVHRTKQLEAPLAQAEANAVADYTKILDALKLNP